MTKLILSPAASDAYGQMPQWFKDLAEQDAEKALVVLGDDGVTANVAETSAMHGMLAAVSYNAAILANMTTYNGMKVINIRDMGAVVMIRRSPFKPNNPVVDPSDPLYSMDPDRFLFLHYLVVQGEIPDSGGSIAQAQTLSMLTMPELPAIFTKVWTEFQAAKVRTPKPTLQRIAYEKAETNQWWVDTALPHGNVNAPSRVEDVDESDVDALLRAVGKNMGFVGVEKSFKGVVLWMRKSKAHFALMSTRRVDTPTSRRSQRSLATSGGFTVLRMRRRRRHWSSSRVSQTTKGPVVSSS
ncbi:MAG: hypothetical protein U0525_02900 [Patescibacteria group bacterium]